MVRPHTKNGLLRDGKENVRMETNGADGQEDLE
jgi:hypothetical protein